MPNPDTTAVIAYAEARSAVEAVQDKPLVDRLKVAMRVTKGHWMCTIELGQLAAAVCAALIHSPQEEKDKVMIELENIKIMNAMIAGVPVDVDRIPKLENPIGILRLWVDTNAA